jgi:hypothetical protein
MIDSNQLERYLLYLRAVSDLFAAHGASSDFAQKIAALVEARRIAREQAGLTPADVEAAAEAIAWARAHAHEIDAAEAMTEAAFIARRS